MSRFVNIICYSSSSAAALQVAALKDHYRNLSANEKKLDRADFIGFTVIPTIAGCFIAGYWILPEYQVNFRNILEYGSMLSLKIMIFMKLLKREGCKKNKAYGGNFP